MDRALMICSLLIAGMIGVTGCNERSQTAVQPNVAAAGGPTVAPAVTATAMNDALTPRYETTLAEGIDFKKAGYPNFLAEVTGVSDQEPGGRWTDAGLSPTAKFRFKQPLPNHLTLEVVAVPFGDNLDQPIIVRIGKKEQTFVASANSEPPLPHVMKFDGVEGADSIEIIPPKPTVANKLDPKSNDTRQLAIALISLKIK